MIKREKKQWVLFKKNKKNPQRMRRQRRLSSFYQLLLPHVLTKIEQVTFTDCNFVSNVIYKLRHGSY